MTAAPAPGMIDLLGPNGSAHRDGGRKMITITSILSDYGITYVVTAPGVEARNFKRHADAESYAECRSLVMDLPVKRVNR